MHQYDLTEQEFSDLQALHQEVTKKGKADCESHILLGKDWPPSQVAQALLIDRFHSERKYNNYYSIEL